MRHRERRIQKLEKKMGVGPPTFEEQQLMARLMAARRRMAASNGEPMPIETEPQETLRTRPAPYGNGLAALLFQARERARLKQQPAEIGGAVDPFISGSGGAQ